MNTHSSLPQKSNELLALLPCLALLFNSACTPIRENAKKPQLEGIVKTEVLFAGSPPQSHLTVSGDAITSRKPYRFEGSVTIKGDIPAHSIIIVKNGKLEVTGNVGAGSRLSVRLPELTHKEAYDYTASISGANIVTPEISSDTAYQTVSDGLLYPQDKSPAVKIRGKIGSGVNILSNGGIQASEWAQNLNYSTGYGRPLEKCNFARHSCKPVNR